MPQVEKPVADPKAAAEKLKAQSASMDEAQEKKLDETIPGGEYMVDGVLVNSEGQPVSKKKKADE